MADLIERLRLRVRDWLNAPSAAESQSRAQWEEQLRTAAEGGPVSAEILDRSAELRARIERAALSDEMLN